MLSLMSEKYGRSPSDYLFNDLRCAHARLCVDMVVFQTYSAWEQKEHEKRERRRRQAAI